MKKITYILFAFAAVLFVVSCQKEETINPNDKNSVTIEFDNRIGDQKLVLGQTKGTNSSNEEFTVTTLNYYISNVSLKKDNGEIVKFPNDYFLIRQYDAASLEATLKDVPAGNYTELTYTIGVDSTKSVSTEAAQMTGVLNPAIYGTESANNMYWSWNSGYIFFKMEGISSAAKANSAGLQKYQLHIGGFGGKTTATANNIKTVTFPLTTNATVRANIAPVIHLICDVTKVFSGVNTISLKQSNVIMNPAIGLTVSANYAKAFMVDHVHNEKE